MMTLSEIDKKILHKLKEDIKEKQIVVGMMLTIFKCNLTDDEKKELYNRMSNFEKIEEDKFIRLIEKYFDRIEDDED